MQHKLIRIYGNVHGVYFRASTKERALRYGITGRVRNLKDGAIEIECSGLPDSMKSFLSWVKKGPIMARVEQVDAVDLPLLNYSDFDIDYSEHPAYPDIDLKTIS